MSLGVGLIRVCRHPADPSKDLMPADTFDTIALVRYA